MALYFFHVHDGIDRCIDPEGDELPDIRAACEKAIEYARELLAQEVMKGKLPLEHSIEISSPEGHVVHTVQFVDAVDVTYARNE